MGYFHKSVENINRHTATPPKKTIPTINVNNPRTKCDMLRPRSRSRSILSANAPPKHGIIIADRTKNCATGLKIVHSPPVPQYRASESFRRSYTYRATSARTSSPIDARIRLPLGGSRTRAQFDYTEGNGPSRGVLNLRVYFH